MPVTKRRRRFIESKFQCWRCRYEWCITIYYACAGLENDNCPRCGAVHVVAIKIVSEE